MIIKRKFLLVLGFMLTWGVSLSANAAALILDSFVDQSPATINLPATKLLMATVNTTADKGGVDAADTTVSIGGSVVAADIAEVCVDYAAAEIACQINPNPLTNILITLAGNQKGGSPFDYRVTLNPSAAGKTIQLTVESIVAATLTDNITLPQSTALRTIAGGAPPTVTTPTFADVTDTTATLGGNVTDPGSAAVTDRGIEWGTTPGGPWPNSVASGTGGTGSFTVPVTGLPSSSNIYFRAWADNGVRAYSAESSFTTNAPAAPPTVTVSAATEIAANQARLGGEVTDIGGAPVTDRGVVWNTTSPAESGGTVVPIGSGLGPFDQIVGSLPAGTLIYFKAYAINTAGTSYSVEDSFTTLAGLATVDTPTVESITVTSAILGGTVSSDGGGTVTDRGVVWNTSSPPESGGTVVSIGSGLGTFSQLVSSLPTGTPVYFRAYATNSAGTAYSTIASFTPSGPPVVDTPTVSSITLKSAVLGGTVSSDGGSSVAGRGIVWNTTSPAETGGTIVPMGSGLGPFSQLVSSLPSASLIYFKAYAINTAGTGYSAESSFSTLSEPTVQASNIAFPQVAGGSIRITWTRGNGDGSVVVIRLQGTGIIAPVDGVDYAANADYTVAPELPVNSQNFVVYKGSSNSVIVRGLTQSTSYSVAIYEYAGTGAATDYLLVTPAEGTQATNAVPVHNMDKGANCSDCHSHGSWFARDAELKVVCEQCHNSSGTASAKLEFDNHLTPGKNPAIDFVDCGLCHELHNPGGSNTTESFNSVTLATQINKSFLRANVDKYVSTAVPPAYLHTDQPLREDPHPDAPQLAVTPDRAVEGGTDATGTSTDQQARGFCQVCHTMTNNHTNNPSTSGSDQSHDGESNTSGLGTETNCGTCHQHNNSFIGAGGSVSCVICHEPLGAGTTGPNSRPSITDQFDRLSSHIGPPGSGSSTVTEPDCLVCHDQTGHSTDAIVGVKDLDTGAIHNQLTAGAPTTDPAEGEQFEGHCLSCHDDGSADSLPASGSDQTATSPFTGSGAPPIIDEIAWASAAHNRSTAPIVSCVGGCHGSGHGSEQLKLLSPAIGPTASAADFCFNCHDADGPSSIDIQAQFAPAPADRQYVTGPAYDTVNNQHDVLPSEQAFSGSSIACSNCHDPHANNNANPVANLDTGSPLSTYSPTNSTAGFTYGTAGDIDAVDPLTTGWQETDYVEFCLTCHDGTAPAGLTMPATMLNIATTWATSQHGAGSNRSTQKGWLKYPFSNISQTVPAPVDHDDGATPYSALNCTTCHGAHGSENIYNLRSSITVAGVQMTVGATYAWEEAILGAQFGSTTYDLPIDSKSGTQEALGWGAWCTFCHDVNHDTKDGFGCQSSHIHGAAGNF